MKWYFLFVLLFFALACNDSKDFKEKAVGVSKRQIDLKYTSFELNSKPISFKIFDVSRDITQLIILNKLSRKIEVYDILENKLLWSDYYENLVGDFDEFGDINSIEFFNSDTIFFLQSDAITLSDTQSVKKSIRINSDEDIEKYDLILTNLGNAPIYYNNKLNALSIQAYCYSCGLYNKSFYQSPINISFELDSHKIQELPVKYSERYLINYYGFHNLVFRNEYDDRYIISFSAEPNLYIYDKKLNSIIVKGGRSKYQIGDTKPLMLEYKKDNNKKLKHISLEPMYKEFLYDKFRNIYYRFFSTGVEEKNPDGTFNGWLDKELILMIFDSDLDIIKEVNLGKGRFSSEKSFVGKKGLYLYNLTKRDKSLKKNRVYYEILEVI